jgi:flavin-dependent dehydrogenase
MPVRATKRGIERTRLQGDCDVLVCGASFAGLAIARELAGSGARVLVIDRYEIGERQTSACGVPTTWLDALRLRGALLQTFGELVVHTPWKSSRWRLPWTFSTFDYRELCALMWEQARSEGGAGGRRPAGRNGDASRRLVSPGFGRAPLSRSNETVFETATVQGREGNTVHTDRGELHAPLIVDALGWRRTLSRATPIQPPNARLSRGLEVHPHGSGAEMELWIDPRYIRAGYGWSFPARDEVRVGVGSFWPTHHVKEPTVRLAHDLDLPPDGYQGNWIPHQLRSAVEDGVFFVGDSAGHCLPLTAEGIRTAFYFGIACGRELRTVLAGHSTREQALSRYCAFSDSHKWKFSSLLLSQRVIGRLTPTPAVTALARAFESPRVCEWAFEHYMRIAPASFVGPSAGHSVPGRRAAAAATA